jgi:ATP-dependent Lon protease
MYEDETHQQQGTPGVAMGLAWTPVGGKLLFIEASSMPGSGKLVLTGNLGNVMKESALLALSWIKSHLQDLEAYSSNTLKPSLFEMRDFHLHFPAGAIPKDGPSAGITITIALISHLIGKPIRSGIAMTGELSLLGQVFRVGGIRDKVLAGYTRGIMEFILPKGNQRDWEADLGEDVRGSVKVHWVDSILDVLEITLGSGRRLIKTLKEEENAAIQAKL